MLRTRPPWCYVLHTHPILQGVCHFADLLINVHWMGMFGKFPDEQKKQLFLLLFGLWDKHGWFPLCCCHSWIMNNIQIFARTYGTCKLKGLFSGTTFSSPWQSPNACMAQSIPSVGLLARGLSLDLHWLCIWQLNHGSAHLWACLEEDMRQTSAFWTRWASPSWYLGSWFPNGPQSLSQSTTQEMDKSSLLI